MLQTIYLRTEWKCNALQLVHSTEGMSQQAYKTSEIKALPRETNLYMYLDLKANKHLQIPKTVLSISQPCLVYRNSSLIWTKFQNSTNSWNEEYFSILSCID